MMKRLWKCLLVGLLLLKGLCATSQVNVDSLKRVLGKTHRPLERLEVLRQLSKAFDPDIAEWCALAPIHPAISEQLTARELVDELNECFKAFDHIITARGIEKIKTIGDAYMCAGGLFGTKGSSPLQVVLAALEMQDYMVKRKAERALHGLPGFDMRLGIHTGPVVAGIVGVKKFQYDIWGDTVNIASRMESSGEIGQVNISEATYALVNATLGLRFTPRGKVQAKGKGEMEIYFVSQI